MSLNSKDTGHIMSSNDFRARDFFQKLSWDILCHVLAMSNVLKFVLKFSKRQARPLPTKAWTNNKMNIDTWNMYFSTLAMSPPWCFLCSTQGIWPIPNTPPLLWQCCFQGQGYQGITGGLGIRIALLLSHDQQPSGDQYLPCLHHW